MNAITCNHIGFIIVGLAAINLWGGGEGTFPMKSTRINTTEPLTQEQIREAVNDGGFGAESIMGAVVRVDTIYEHGAKTYGDAQIINFSPAGAWSRHLGEVLSWGHEQSPVSVWECDDDQLKTVGLA